MKDAKLFCGFFTPSGIRWCTVYARQIPMIRLSDAEFLLY
jgi:hypothetical protein